MGIGQGKFGALGQRRFQRPVGAVAAILRHRLLVIRKGRGLGGNTGLKAPPDMDDGFGIVLQQLVLRGQTELVQHRHGRAAQQSCKPAVEGAHLHRPAGQKQRVVQAAQGLELLGRGLCGHAAQLELFAQGSVIRLRKIAQPLVQALAHLTRRFFGEGDGQNFMGGRPFQQGTHHAGHQHPGFARTCAGLHRHTATRVARNRVKLFAGHAPAIDLVGGPLDGAAHAWLQKSLRHKPRAWQ